jgi:hypothetical protein
LLRRHRGIIPNNFVFGNDSIRGRSARLHRLATARP